MSRREKYMSRVRELCEMNGMDSLEKDDPMTISVIAADHYQKVSEFSYEVGYVVPEEYKDDPEDITTVAGLLSTVFMAEERLQHFLEHWGLEAAEYDFAPELLDGVVKVFKERFEQINKERQEEGVANDDQDTNE